MTYEKSENTAEQLRKLPELFNNLESRLIEVSGQHDKDRATRNVNFIETQIGNARILGAAETDIAKLEWYKRKFKKIAKGSEVSGEEPQQPPKMSEDASKAEERSKDKEVVYSSEAMREWKENIHFTVDDGPHPNDIEIAKKAIEKGLKVTFFWNGINLLTSDSREKLSRIPATVFFQNTSYNSMDLLRTSLDAGKVEIVRQVYSMSKEHPDNVNIAYHGMFHPHSGNTQVNGDVYDADSKKSGEKIQYKSQLHLREQTTEYIQDDIRFFEKIIQVATSDAAYRVRQVRLPGTNEAMAKESGYIQKLPQGVSYAGWSVDSQDWNNGKMTTEQVKTLRGNVLFHSKNGLLLDIFKQLDTSPQSGRRVDQINSARGQKIIDNPALIYDIADAMPEWNRTHDICSGFLDEVDRSLGLETALFDLIPEYENDKTAGNAWRISSSGNMERVHMGSYTSFSDTDKVSEHPTIQHTLPTEASEWYEALTASNGRRYFSFLYVKSNWKQKIAEQFQKGQEKSPPIKITPNSHIAEIVGIKKFSEVITSKTDLRNFLIEKMSNRATGRSSVPHQNIDTLLPSMLPYLNVRIDGKKIEANTMDELTQIILNSATKIEWSDYMIMDYFYQFVDGKPKKSPRVIPLSTMLLDPSFIPVEIFKVKDEAIQRKEQEREDSTRQKSKKREESPQSEEMRHYLQRRIDEMLGKPYDSFDCQGFLECVLMDVQDERLQEYFRVIQGRGDKIKYIRNGEILTAVLNGEIPLENINENDLYNYLVQNVLPFKGGIFKNMSKRGIETFEEIASAKEKIMSDLKSQIGIGEYAIISWSFDGGGHTGIALRTGENTLSFYNAGLIESEKKWRVGVENLDTELDLLFQKTRGEIEWVNKFAAYFHYTGPQKGHLVLPDGAVLGSCTESGGNYYYNGEKLTLNSSMEKKKITFTIGRIPQKNFKIPKDVPDTLVAQTKKEKALILDVLSKLGIGRTETGNWTNHLFESMKKSGIKITENNIRYIVAILQRESGMSHDPLKWHAKLTKEKRKEGLTYGGVMLDEFQDLLSYVPDALTPDFLKENTYNEQEQAIIEGVKKCDTDLQFYIWAQRTLATLRDNPNIFKALERTLPDGIFRAVGEKVRSIFKKHKFSIEQTETVRSAMIRYLENFPETFGAFAVNANIIVARMNADMTGVQNDPELRKLLRDGKVNRDLLVRNLCQDSSLGPLQKINEATALSIALKYYVKPNIYAIADNGEIQDETVQYAFIDHHLGVAASRNTAIQSKLNQLSQLPNATPLFPEGKPLELDGDLVSYNGLRMSDEVSNTQKAIENFIQRYMPNWSGSAPVKAQEICRLLSEKEDMSKAIVASSTSPASIFLARLDEVYSNKGFQANAFVIPLTKSTAGQAAKDYSGKCVANYKKMKLAN